MAKKYLNFVFAALFVDFFRSVSLVLFATNVYADDDSTEQSSETEEEDMIHLQVEPGKKSLYDLTPRRILRGLFHCAQCRRARV